MNEFQVLELMRTSKNETEWNQNCDKVKKVCNGYPDFWFKFIILSGKFEEIKSKWQKDNS